MVKKTVSKAKAVKPTVTATQSRISFQTRTRFFMLEEPSRQYCIQQIREEEDFDLAQQFCNLKSPGKQKSSINYDDFWEQDIKPILANKWAWWDEWGS